MPKTVGRLPAHVTDSFRADVAGHTKQQLDQVKAEAVAQKPGDMAATSRAADGVAQCRACGIRVYEMEKLVADNYAYHKKCFKCCKCGSTLRVGNYASMDAQIFCKPHFVECFKQKGNYEEGFGKEKLGSQASTLEKKSTIKGSIPKIDALQEKENVPIINKKGAHEDKIVVEAAATAPSAPAAASVEAAAPATAAAAVVDQDSQSVTSLNPAEFSLALEEKKRKLLQAAQACTENGKDKLQRPAPGKLRPAAAIISLCEQSPTSGSSSDGICAARQRTGAVSQIAATIANGGDQLANAGTEPTSGGAAHGTVARHRLLDPSAAHREPRPISWCGEPTSVESGGGSGSERRTHAVAATATIAPGSLKMKLLDLEAAKEASRATAATQRQLRMEADARAAAEAAAQVGADAPPEPASAPARSAEVATVKSRFESFETNLTTPPSARMQTAAREEAEQVRSAVGQRAAAIRSRFQKKVGNAGLSAARSLPDLSPAAFADDDADEADEFCFGLLDDEPLPASRASAKNEETVPKPGQLKSILSKLQSIQDSADNKEKVRPRPLLVTDVDRHRSDYDSEGDGTSSKSSDNLLPDAKFQEQPWPKKAKSLREKFESYEQHNKAMGMKVKYVVESKGAENASAEARTETTIGKQ